MQLTASYELKVAHTRTHTCTWQELGITCAVCVYVIKLVAFIAKPQINVAIDFSNQSREPTKVAQPGSSSSSDTL